MCVGWSTSSGPAASIIQSIGVLAVQVEVRRKILCGLCSFILSWACPLRDRCRLTHKFLPFSSPQIAGHNLFPLTSNRPWVQVREKDSWNADTTSEL